MSLECVKYKGNFSAVIDRQLNWQPLDALEKHLGDCSECSLSLAELKEFHQWLAQCLSQGSESAPDLWPAIGSHLPNLCELMCSDFSAFCDGELSSSAQEGVKHHLHECRDCSKQFRQLHATNQLILGSLELPPQIEVDLLSSIRSQLNESCTLIESELSAFVDQEMPHERHRDVMVHILGCSSCSEGVRSFSNVGDLVGQHYLAKVPDNLDLMPGIRRKLQVVPFKLKEEPKPARRKFILAGAIALIACLVCGLFYLGWAMNKPPVISSEDYLIQAMFDHPRETPEAMIIHEQ